MNGFLDGPGLSEVWKRIKGLFGSTFVQKDGVIEVKTPVEAIAQSDYDDLSEEDRNKDVLYLVDEPQWCQTTLSVQEYDTTTDDGTEWHVRKWSDGYVEMSGKQKLENVKVDQRTSSGIYISSVKYRLFYPMMLSRLYGAAIAGGGATGELFLASSKDSIDYELTYTPSFMVCIFSSSAATVPGLNVYAHVTGRWK